MLKKTALAVAVAGMLAPLASQAAGPTVYGKLFVGLDKYDAGTSAATDNQWDVHGFTSRVGVKGDHDLGGGMSAFYTYEFAVDAAEANFPGNNRLSFAGLKTPAGSVSIGKQWGAYYNIVGTHTDPTYWVGSAAVGYLGFGQPGRTSNTIKYSNSFGPVTVEADAIANAGGAAAGDTSSSLDRTALGASVKFGPVTVAAATDVTDKEASGATDDTKITGIAAAYDLKVVNIHAGYEQLDDGSASKTKTITAYVGGSMDKLGYAVGIGRQEDDDTVGKEQVTPWFYVTYSFNKSTTALLEYRQDSFDVGNDISDLVLALIVDF